MLVIDKIIELTGGKYHYKAKEITHLLNTEMRRIHTWHWKDKTFYDIEASVQCEWRGMELYKVLRLSFTTTGKNKGSWRIISTFSDMKNGVYENE